MADGSEQEEMVFALSSGRTGTVFLTNTLPQRFPQLVARHEPDGSRYVLMLANLRDYFGVGTGPLRSILEGRLDKRRHVGAGKTYIEINPMLVPMTDLLPAHAGPLNVVHLTRHPASWTRSIRAFKASGYRRHLIDWVPFANPYPTPRPAGWLGLSRVERALWRWRYSNDRILELEDRADRYVRVRFEDLFHHGDEDALRRLLWGLGLDPDVDVSGLLEGRPANPAPSVERQVDVPAEAIERICGPILEKLGYTVEEDRS